MTGTAALVAASLVPAALRVAGVTHPAFQAAAHLWVGGLLGAGLAGGGRRCYWIAGALSVVEVVVFVARLSFHPDASRT